PAPAEQSGWSNPRDCGLVDGFLLTNLLPVCPVAHRLDCQYIFMFLCVSAELIRSVLPTRAFRASSGLFKPGFEFSYRVGFHRRSGASAWAFGAYQVCSA